MFGTFADSQQHARLHHEMRALEERDVQNRECPWTDPESEPLYQPRVLDVNLSQDEGPGGIHKNRSYLVSLAGETEWVRNLRASDGKAVIRHGPQAEVRVTELPVDQRVDVLEAYLSKRALSTSAATAARDYFGVAPHPSSDALLAIADHYPVFRISPLATA